MQTLLTNLCKYVSVSCLRVLPSEMTRFHIFGKTNHFEMQSRIIEIPLRPVVKKYYQHFSNLGPKPIIEKRHWLGRHICSIVSFHPLDREDLPVEYTEGNMDRLETLAIEVTFPLKTDHLSPHHLYAIGASCDSMFEIAVMNYCRGRFAFSVNYSAAISEFFRRYDLYSVDYSEDHFRKFIHKKYGANIQAEIDAFNEMKRADLQAIAAQ